MSLQKEKAWSILMSRSKNIMSYLRDTTKNISPWKNESEWPINWYTDLRQRPYSYRRRNILGCCKTSLLYCDIVTWHFFHIQWVLTVLQWSFRLPFSKWLHTIAPVIPWTFTLKFLLVGIGWIYIAHCWISSLFWFSLNAYCIYDFRKVNYK